MLKKSVVVLAVLALIVLAAVAVMPRNVTAAEEKAELFDLSNPVPHNVGELAGRVITVHLSSGETMSGKVEAVSGELLHLSQLTGKEYYDALVRFDAIVAVEARARQ